MLHILDLCFHYAFILPWNYVFLKGLGTFLLSRICSRIPVLTYTHLYFSLVMKKALPDISPLTLDMGSLDIDQVNNKGHKKKKQKQEHPPLSDHPPLNDIDYGTDLYQRNKAIDTPPIITTVSYHT